MLSNWLRVLKEERTQEKRAAVLAEARKRKRRNAKRRKLQWLRRNRGS